MIFIVVLMPDSFYLLKISILIALQAVCLAYNILKRSFAECKDQTVEIFNEFVFLILILFLVHYPSESDWIHIAEDAFIGIIMSQIWILTAVSMISSIIKLAK